MNTSKGKISVIIPVYNRTIFLEEALRSIVDQSYSNVEVILVNDGSGAEVSRSLMTLCEKYPFAQMVELDQHLGVSGARNKGIRQATGDFLHFLDDDDWIAPEFYEKAVHQLQQGDVKVIIGDGAVFSAVDGGHQFKRQRSNFEYIRKKYGSMPIEHWSYFLVYCPPIHSMLFKVEVFHSHQFPEDLNYGEDRWLGLEMKKHGVKFDKMDYLGAHYRLATSTARSKDQQVFFEALLKSDLLDTREAKNYVQTFLCILLFKKKALLKSISYKLQALSSPVLFIRNLWYLFGLR